MIGDIPWGIGYRSEKFGLISQDDSYGGLVAHPHRKRNIALYHVISCYAGKWWENAQYKLPNLSLITRT